MYGGGLPLSANHGHSFHIAEKPTTGYSRIDGKSFRGKVAYYYVIDNKLAHVSWVFKRNLLANQLDFKDYQVIGDCVTYEEFRGRGLYGQMVAQIISHNRGVNFILFIDPDNRPSIRGIEKIGLKCLGVFEVFRFLGLAAWISKIR